MKSRKDRRSAQKREDIEKYLEWLRRKDHTDLVELVTINRDICAQIFQMIADSQLRDESAINGLVVTVFSLRDRVDKLPSEVRSGFRDELANQLATLCKRLDEAAQEILAIDEAKAHDYEARYREAIIRECGKIELFGADLSPETQSQELSVAYMPLSVTQGCGTGETSASVRADELMNTAMLANGRLLIRAPAGAGKTTLLRWWAHSAASKLANAVFEQACDARADIVGASYTPLGALIVERRSNSNLSRLRERGWRPWNERIPFLLRVRSLKGEGLPKPEDFPSQVAEHLGEVPENWVVNELRRGALLLVDGIDEISKNRRDVIRKGLLNYAGAYPNTIIVVTTRPTAVREDWLKEAGFVEVQIDDMAPADREIFVRKWHEALSRVLKSLGRPDDSGNLADSLIAELRRNPALSLLARNPLLAAMTCALHRDRRSKLPESQRELVEALSHMLVFRREHESPGFRVEEFPECYRSLDYPSRVAILRRIAEFMVIENNRSKLPLDVARQKVESALTGLRGKNPADAEVILDQLVERSGVLRKSGQDEIDFLHNTFKEYYAARELVSEVKYRTLASHATDPEWDNILLFAAADPDKKACAKELITLVIPADRSKARRRIPQAHDAEDYRRRLLAVRLASVAVYLDKELENRVQALEKTVIPPRSAFDAAALASLGQGCERLLAYNPKVSVAGRRWCARALRLIGTEAALVELEAYLVDENRQVGTELAEVFEPLRIAAWRTAVSTGKLVELPSRVLARIRDLSPLAGLITVECIDLGGTQAFDISPLAGLRNLRRLNLAGTQVSSLGPLAGLNDLQLLILSGTQVSDLSPLTGFNRLQGLYLHGTQVGNLAVLASLTNLRRLNISGTPVRDLSPLAGLNDMENLYCSGTQVSDLKPIESLINLQVLDVALTQVSDLSALARLNDLQSLDLRGTQVGDLSPLANLNNLRVLNLRGTQVSDLSPLASLSNLQYLDLDDTQVSDLSPLGGLSSLRRLNLSRAKTSNLSPLSGVRKRLKIYLTATQARAYFTEGKKWNFVLTGL
ncbi:MAG: leucine-rich repeat domain-containing protein [Phycisphaerae bacterium]|nr:leucine-rich repeat domain-containing protein [Phycisphaerae bacterium]